MQHMVDIPTVHREGEGETDTHAMILATYVVGGVRHFVVVPVLTAMSAISAIAAAMVAAVEADVAGVAAADVEATNRLLFIQALGDV